MMPALTCFSFQAYKLCQNCYIWDFTLLLQSGNQMELPLLEIVDYSAQVYKLWQQLHLRLHLAAAEQQGNAAALRAN